MQAVEKSRFLVIAGLVMILYAVAAFAAVSLVQPARFESFVKPLALVHMVAGMGWLILFFSQARLAHRGEIARHRSRMNLALAADIPHHTRLSAADATVKKRSPLCGSTVTVDVSVTSGHVSLTGTSYGNPDLEAIEKVVRQVKGVASVDSQIIHVDPPYMG